MTTESQTCAYPPCESERFEGSELCHEHKDFLDFIVFSLKSIMVHRRPVLQILSQVAVVQNAAEQAMKPGGLTLPGQMPPRKPGNGRV